MENVLLVAYLLIVLALIAVILLQRSEGGGLGMGGGGGGFMTARGSANLLTRATAILATLFFVTAIGLTILSQVNRGSTSILDRAADGVENGAGAPTSVLDALNQMQGDTPAAPAPVDAEAPDLALPVTPGAAGTVEAPAADAPAVEAPAASSQDSQPATPQSPGTETTPAPTGN